MNLCLCHQYKTHLFTPKKKPKKNKKTTGNCIGKLNTKIFNFFYVWISLQTNSVPRAAAQPDFSLWALHTAPISLPEIVSFFILPAISRISLIQIYLPTTSFEFDFCIFFLLSCLDIHSIFTYACSSHTHSNYI